MIDVVKMHGTGNDFPVVLDLDDRLDVSPEAVRRLCHRHLGIGGDGFIRIAPGAGAPFFMDYRNSDGSVAEICGNGVRVCGKYLGDRGFVEGDAFDLETRGGVKRLDLSRSPQGSVETVSVDMGMIEDIHDASIEVDGVAYAATVVAAPNPHAVIFVDDVDKSPVEVIGPRIEWHELFPLGTNVEFVDHRDGRLRQRTWERGAGETLACGSGACAVAVAAHVKGLTGDVTDVELRGGTLTMQWSPGTSLRMTGPAAEVFQATIDPAAFGIIVR